MRFRINDEFSPLQRVVIGLGAPYQRDKSRVATEMAEFPFLPRTEWREDILALRYPTEHGLTREFDDYVAALRKYGVEVLRADPGAAYSFDYTCPRDIGFCIGERFFISNMAVPSRSDEILTLSHHLSDYPADCIVRFPPDAIIEGGDVIVLDRDTVLVGINQRTNRAGYEHLRDCLAPLDITAVAVSHSQLHLDCCLNPLGHGHLLIHPASLDGNGEELWRMLKQWRWIEVDDDEREHLATNVLSVDGSTVIVRDYPGCGKTNTALRQAGYHLEKIKFDGTPAVGGSFRCASLPLRRRSAT